MASKSETVDVESLQRRGARRGQCLDGCLVFSVLVLFAGLASVTAAGLMVVRDLQSQLNDRPQPEYKPEMLKVEEGAPDRTFKMQNFAYLEAASSKLNNHTMMWSKVSFLNGKSVGSNYVFDPVQHWLQVKQAGVYFLYMNLNLTCVGRCQKSHIRIHGSDSQGFDKLRCDVHLPNLTSTQPQQKKCWTVTSLEANTTLQFKMSLPDGPLHGWKLELEHEKSIGGGSGFGIFLVGQ